MKNSSWLLSILLIVVACTNKNESDVILPASEIASKVISDASNIVIYPTYKQLHERSIVLNNSLIILSQNPTQDNLLVAQNNWRSVRESWELSEAFLFGPVSTDNIDPGIDTWPVNRPDMDSLLATNTTFDVTFLNNQQESLKGFHPLEYIIFGQNSSRTVAEISPKMMSYTLSLGSYLESRTQELETSWSSTNTQSFFSDFIASGNSGKTFPTKESALLEIVYALSGICGEVGEGKIGEAVLSQNPELEESPFSQNSMIDFKKNVEGVDNLYNCKFQGKQGTSLSQFVKQYNLSLDQKINNQISVCKQSLAIVNEPFSKAIFSQQQQLNSATKSLLDLEEIIENELVPLIRQRIND
jgi:predicted lipoprotein